LWSGGSSLAPPASSLRAVTGQLLVLLVDLPNSSRRNALLTFRGLEPTQVSAIPEGAWAGVREDGIAPRNAGANAGVVRRTSRAGCAASDGQALHRLDALDAGGGRDGFSGPDNLPIES
jgi:hypothetical protein